MWIPAFAGMALTGCKQAAPVDPASLIACQPDGASAFTRDCTVERAESPDGTVLTLHHPDGRFRRLLVAKGGQGVTAADGAEPAEVRMSGDHEIEVTLAGDRYRLPAKSKSASTQ
jgi:hypothetical protein